MININFRLVKILAIFVGIPLLIFGVAYFLKDQKIVQEYVDTLAVKVGLKKEAKYEKLSKDDMVKFGSYVISEHNKLYTAKTERQYEILLNTIYLDPDKHKEEAEQIYKMALKHNISESIVSVEGDNEKVKQEKGLIYYSNKVYRHMLYGNGQRYIQESNINVTYKKDEENGLYKIVELEFSDTKTREEKK